jgi:hypothetical protein
VWNQLSCYVTSADARQMKLGGAGHELHVTSTLLCKHEAKCHTKVRVSLQGEAEKEKEA